MKNIAIIGIVVIMIIAITPSATTAPPGDGYAGDIGHPHNQDLNTSSDVTFNSVSGDGSGLTGILHPLQNHNPFNQDLNTTSDVTFNSVSGDGSGLTGILHPVQNHNPFNQDLNTTSDVTFNSVSGDGSGLTGIVHPLQNHNPFNQDLNTSDITTFLRVFAESFHGDGGNLTNITASGDGYAGDKGHPHNQDLNTSDITTFLRVFAESFHGDGGNLTNITASGDGYAGDMGHPHDQDLNETSDVRFGDITNAETDTWTLDARNYDMHLDNQLGTTIEIFSTGETTKRYESAARARLTVNYNYFKGLWQQLPLNNEDYDQNSDYDTLSYRFYPPKNGLYQISYSVYVYEQTDRQLLMSAIFKNNVQAGGLEISHASTSSATDMSNSGADILQLTSEDYIDLRIYMPGLGIAIFPVTTYSNYIAICKIA